ncbi:DUF58 domain-containing protein [Crocinitomicaceae bacterium]|nr:DUF58 domain-containing protein [Crocinitomicaceae bacterium]MDC0099566.1 DUF58 domain-containing protein [Crocinitomicaceae bacterium]
MKVIKNIHLTRWFFALFSGVIILYIVAYSVPAMEFIANVVLASLIGLTAIDALLVFTSANPIVVTRDVNARLNLGDDNKVVLTVRNTTPQPINFSLIEGYPVEMQDRKTVLKGTLLPEKEKVFEYQYDASQRGKFEFGDVFIIIRSMFFMASRGVTIPLKQDVHVYPSVLQMKKYELLVFQQQKTSSGIKKIRRLGNNSEFEQIKNYVQGDDLKSINWKATSRRNELMVNQYQEEKSQSIYCIIDKSRNMQMDFDGLSLLDYSINSSLVFSNIALRKGDKAGLITYSDKIGTLLAAEKSAGQMRRIHESLYNQKTQFKESNFEILYQSIRQIIRSRSLLVLFTNFETEFSMRRAIPMLRRLNQKHVLVVIFFQNSELQEIAYQPSKNIKEVYTSVVAERMISLKSKIARELRQNGIQTVLTIPSELSVNTINKYLELKAKGSI